MLVGLCVRGSINLNDPTGRPEGMVASPEPPALEKRPPGWRTAKSELNHHSSQTVIHVQRGQANNVQLWR